MEGKHLLKLADLSREEIFAILDLADQLKYDQKHGISHRRLEGKSLAMLFETPSTRTRVSFETGLFQLGGHALFLSARDVQDEPAEDTARALGRYCDGIMVRARDQAQAETLAQYAGVPVINGRSDLCHPCQVLADLMTIREYKAELAGLKACYLGDGNQIANSTIVGCLKCGMEVSVFCPPGRRPAGPVLEFAGAIRDAAFTLTESSPEAARDADVIITDLWPETEDRDLFAGCQINASLMAAAHPDCMVQHGLPARKGREITAEVFEAHAGEIFDEAENRLHVQKAVMALLLGSHT